MRIRIKKKPPSIEVAELDVGMLVVGETVDVPARLATWLIVSGCAEPVSGAADRASAADQPPARRKKR